MLSVLLCNATVAQVPSAVLPNFTFYKTNQTTFSNKNLSKGKICFFVFFDTSCDHCMHAITYLNQHCNELENVSVYLISLENNERVIPFLKRFGNRLLLKQNRLLLQDKKNEFIQKFTPKKYPSLFLYSPTGKLLLYDDEEKNLPLFLKKIKG